MDNSTIMLQVRVHHPGFYFPLRLQGKHIMDGAFRFAEKGLRNALMLHSREAFLLDDRTMSKVPRYCGSC